MLSLENLRTVRSFIGSADEAAFVLTHVAMAAESPKLVQAQMEGVTAAATGNDAALVSALNRHADALQSISTIFNRLWYVAHSLDC
jgi:hypothetical protein